MNRHAALGALCIAVTAAGVLGTHPAQASSRADVCENAIAVRAEHFDFRLIVGAAVVFQSCRVSYGYGVADATGRPSARSYDQAGAEGQVASVPLHTEVRKP